MFSFIGMPRHLMHKIKDKNKGIPAFVNMGLLIIISIIFNLLRE